MLIGDLVMASWKVVMSVVMIINGLSLGSWNAIYGEESSLVFGWASFLITVGFGIPVDGLLKRDKDKTDA